MAKVTLTIVDVGEGDIAVTLEADPHIPTARVRDRRHRAIVGPLDVDFEHATPAMVAARLAAHELMDAGEAARLFVREPDGRS